MAALDPHIVLDVRGAQHGCTDGGPDALAAGRGAEESKAKQRAAEERAYGEFFRAYQPPITSLTRKRGLSRHDAEDVVQDVMLSAWCHLNGSVAREGCAHFRGLVLKMADNRVIDQLRRQRVRRETESLSRLTSGAAATGRRGTLADQADEAPGPQERCEREEQLAALTACLEGCATHLAARTMAAFRLYVLDGVSAAETAATLAMSPNQVYVIRNQVIDRVRRLMAVAV